MKERPILFSGEMVRAILDGRKTQTRRVVKFIPMLGEPVAWCAAAKAQEPGWVHIVGDYRRFCPYGQPGDRLWVKETWYDSRHESKRCPVTYRANTSIDEDIERDFKWTPSIFMPRWASRITLEITAIRVERLNEIDPDDCAAEGIEVDDECDGWVEKYSDLWDSINGDRPGCKWSDNPWVWVVTFKRIGGVA